MNSKNESELILSLKDGNSESFEKLYQLYADKVFGLSFLLLKDTGWSEDVVQEVFVKIWNSRSSLEEEKSLWSFIYVLTKRSSLNKLRDIQKFDSQFEYLWENISILNDCSHEKLIAKELQARVEELLNGLPERQREVFRMSRMEGYSYQEIGERLNISPNTVKNHMIQALKTIKSQLKHIDYLLLLFFLIS